MNKHHSTVDIEARASALGASPADHGRVEMIVCRPEPEKRLSLDKADLDSVVGLVGDCWLTRGSKMTPDGNAHPGMQLTLMNSRVIGAIAPDRSDWPPAGDQLFVDLDLSEGNLPPGQRLSIGTAVVEITEVPHTGCAQFAERYGPDAVRFVNSPEGRRLRRRGVNARILQSGTVRTGDVVAKVAADQL